MPAKKYIVKLTDEERQSLVELTSRGEVRARTMKRAQILLKADEDEGCGDCECAEYKSSNSRTHS